MNIRYSPEPTRRAVTAMDSAPLRSCSKYMEIPTRKIRAKRPIHTKKAMTQDTQNVAWIQSALGFPLASANSCAEKKSFSRANTTAVVKITRITDSIRWLPPFEQANAGDNQKERSHIWSLRSWQAPPLFSSCSVMCIFCPWQVCFFSKAYKPYVFSYQNLKNSYFSVSNLIPYNWSRVDFFWDSWYSKNNIWKTEFELLSEPFWQPQSSNVIWLDSRRWAVCFHP